MKRLGLVLFVCVALPANAATAPLVHLHTDITHGSDHHDGRQFHRHAPPPAAAQHASHHDSAGRQEAPDTEAAIELGATLWFLVPASIASVKPADGTALSLMLPPSPLARTMDAAAAPLVWPPPILANSADVRRLTPRGPPR